VEYLERAVASHLRVCLTTTEDRMWSFTAYPSEPFLAHIAALLLHDTPTNLLISLRSLQTKLESGMINKGANGEIVSRFLLQLCKDLVAKDLYVMDTVPAEPTPTLLESAQTHPSSSYPVFRGKDSDQETCTFNQPLLYCRDIPVIAFLEKLFGQNAWPTDNKQKTRARMAFKDAYINFSHWVTMTQNIASSDDEVKYGTMSFVRYITNYALFCCSSEEWSFRHWCRTSAVQCCHLQNLIDKAIPIFIKHPGRTPLKSVSHILISDKMRTNSSPTDVFNIKRIHDSINLPTTHPWIAITLDLGLSDTKFRSTFPARTTSDSDNQCLRIWASGMSSETFPFLGDIPGLEQVMKEISARHQIPPFKRPLRQELQNQFKFGTTSSDDHMIWENGRRA
jgi:hypothetical protein